MIQPKDGRGGEVFEALGRSGWTWHRSRMRYRDLRAVAGHKRHGAHGVTGRHRRAGRRRPGTDAAMTTRRNRRVQPRPRVYEPNLPLPRYQHLRRPLSRWSSRARASGCASCGSGPCRKWRTDGACTRCISGRASPSRRTPARRWTRWTFPSWARTPRASFPGTRGRAACAMSH